MYNPLNPPSLLLTSLLLMGLGTVSLIQQTQAWILGKSTVLSNLNLWVQASSALLPQFNIAQNHH